MNLPSRTSAVLTDLRGGISGSIQDTVRLKQEWTNVGQAIQSAGSKAGGLVKGGGPGGQSSSKIAPDANFSQQQQASNNQVFSSPAQAAIGGGNNGGGDVAVPGGPGGYGSNNNPGMFRNLSDFVSQNRTGAVLYGAGTALMGAHSTSDMVEAQLLMQRNAAFMTTNPGRGSLLDRMSSTTDPFGALSANGQGNLTNQYEYTRRSAAKMAAGGASNDPMDSYRAMAAAQSYGINGPNFMQRAGTRDQFEGSVMSGISNVSNLTPGMGLEGTTRAYGGMQQARSVNMLKGVGINIRDEQGNMKPMDVIIDDLWKKITRDVSKDGKGAVTERDIIIAFQPGNSMDSMVQNMFGDDPLVYTAVKNGLIYKARTNGAAITSEGALDAGFTTKAVQTKQKANALGTRGIGQSSNAGAAAYGGVQGFLNDISETALTADDIAGIMGPLKAFNALAAILQTAGGAGGGMGNSVMGFLMALLGKGGFKAEGGNVGGESPYVVGEKGPELFIPKTDGVIIPNHLMGTKNRHEGGGVKHSHKGETLKDAEVRKILKQAGFAEGQELDEAVAIARAESGFRTNAEGDKELARQSSLWDYSIGLMQIRAYDDPKKDPKRDSSKLYDPLFNAQTAYKIYKGSNDWRAWENSATKLGFKGGRSNDSNFGSGSGAGSGSTSTENPFKGTQFEKGYAEFLKTGGITDSTYAGMMGGGGMNGAGMSDLINGMTGGGSTVNYGGVTFNVTTPADNKSFIESIKKALKDLNFLGIGKD
jgi:hypothetical protein